KKVLGLKNFSLNIRKGEIVGIAGVEGNGQAELVEAITGMRNVEQGKIIFNGKDITKDSIRKRIDEGIAHIPEDRHKRGLILDYTMEDNLVLKVYKNRPFSKFGLMDRKKITDYANKIVENFDVRSGEGGKSIARSLSGGNQQKGIIGREIQSNPDLLIAVQPTRGLDVGSIEYIHKRLVEQRDNGKAVLLVSLELDEVLNVSDRIAIVNNGELIGIVNANDTDENEVGLMMAGIKRGES
ncbi:ATP-binding cassette domain-containing protein, partial [Clostridium sp. Sa3CUN1]